jgi:hypothetical protein
MKKKEENNDGEREGQYSYYSNDYYVKKKPNKRTGKTSRKIVTHSRVHLYNKKEKDIIDNQISHKVLDKNPNEIRLEFKLFRDNCNHLSLENISGDYKTVLKNYTPLLAVNYNNNVLGNIQIKGKGNKELTKVIRKSKEGGTRFRGKNLVPTEPIPEWARSGKKDYTDQMRQMISEQKVKKGKLPEIVKEHIEKMILEAKKTD